MSTTAEWTRTTGGPSPSVAILRRPPGTSMKASSRGIVGMLALRLRSSGMSHLLLLVDLDGVVYRGAVPVPGVAAVLAARAAAGDDVVYVTNNSMHYRADYVTRLTELGAPVSADRIVSAPRATATYLREHEPE